MPGTRRLIGRTIAALLGAGLALSCAGLAAAATSPADFKPITQGGVRPDSRIVEVTTLDSMGPGSLAEALAAPGPKIITFKVAGVINMPTGSLTIGTPFTTIAGETAPAPGIELTGGTLQIRSHDIVVRHIAVRVEGPQQLVFTDPPDGINIGGNPKRYGAPIRNVLLENVSVSWGVDENVDAWYQGTGDIQLRSMIIAEGLMKGGHPKGIHSMGMLVATGVDNLTLEDSLFAHNNDRHPRVSPGTQVSSERNVVYDPGHEATEIFLNCTKGDPPMQFTDNVLKPGPSTWHKIIQYDYRRADNEDVRLTYGDPSCAAAWPTLAVTLADPETQAQVFDDVLTHAGSRPNNRDATDTRIVMQARTGTGALKDHGDIVAAGPPGPSVFVMPADPFAKLPDGQLAIADALCQAHLKLGGLPYAGCTS